MEASSLTLDVYNDPANMSVVDDLNLLALLTFAIHDAFHVDILSTFEMRHFCSRFIVSIRLSSVNFH